MHAYVTRAGDFMHTNVMFRASNEYKKTILAMNITSKNHLQMQFSGFELLAPPDL